MRFFDFLWDQRTKHTNFNTESSCINWLPTLSRFLPTFSPLYLSLWSTHTLVLLQSFKKYPHCSCTISCCLCVCISVDTEQSHSCFLRVLLRTDLRDLEQCCSGPAVQLIRWRISQASTWAASQRPDSLWGSDVSVTQIWIPSFLDQLWSQMTDKPLKHAIILFEKKHVVGNITVLFHLL